MDSNNSNNSKDHPASSALLIRPHTSASSTTSTSLRVAKEQWLHTAMTLQRAREQAELAAHSAIHKAFSQLIVHKNNSIFEHSSTALCSQSPSQLTSSASSITNSIPQIPRSLYKTTDYALELTHDLRQLSMHIRKFTKQVNEI